MCVRACVCMCVRSPISHYNFVKCGSIVTKLAMEVARYGTCIVEKYHWNRSKVNVKVTEIVKNTSSL